MVSPGRRSLRPASSSSGPLRATLVALAVVSSGVSLVACGGGGDGGGGSAGEPTSGTEPAESYSGYTVDPPSDVSAVVLPRADGTGDVAMPATPGGLRVVYFGYTSCPDVCPTTMSDLRRALESLPDEERSKVQVAMVTIDPARDLDENFTGYVTRFIADAAALRTQDDAVLRAAADSFGANYEVTTDDAGEVEVSHTGELYAVDDQGLVVMQWPFGTSHESLARDLRSLLADSGRPEALSSGSATP